MQNFLFAKISTPVVGYDLFTTWLTQQTSLNIIYQKHKQ